MSSIALPALRGRNPIGLFAALGALDVATRLLPDRTPRLHWTEDVDPHAVIEGPDGLDHLVELCVADLDRWKSSPVLLGPPDEQGTPQEAADLKVKEAELTRWITYVAARAAPEDLADLRLQSALVAEGAFAKGKKDDRESKPTHFHFTAGRQLFLVMVRELRDGITAERLYEALVGPWRYDSELPVLGWDSRGERIYALSGPSPASVKKTGVPGADWLGLLGLRFFPVSVQNDRYGRDPELVTTGCSRGWKSGKFTWPLWDRPLPAEVIASLVSHQGLSGMTAKDRAALGVHALLTAPIRRSDQGGYGSFGAPAVE